jgi:hypothetical protein
MYLYVLQNQAYREQHCKGRQKEPKCPLFMNLRKKIESLSLARLSSLV